MSRIRFIEHRGTRLLFSNLAGISGSAELQRATRDIFEIAQAQPPRSLLILADLTGVDYSIEAFAIVQQSVATIRPYVRARAVVGLRGASLVPFQLIAKIAGSPMRRFDDLESAKEWLITQA